LDLNQKTDDIFADFMPKPVIAVTESPKQKRGWGNEESDEILSVGSNNEVVAEVAAVKFEAILMHEPEGG
jgi:hypothetical protein